MMTIVIPALVCVCLLADFIGARTDVNEWVWSDDCGNEEWLIFSLGMDRL